MTTSDWITIGSVLISMSFTIAVILFRMGVVLGGIVKTMEAISLRVDEIASDLKILSAIVSRIEITLTKHEGRIKRLEKDVSKHRRSR
ncbi:MAG TPA: hypothetical protein VK508_19340 [Cyclobacteriaceae bacterium]|nr:hypothetical protein [Cyclobacteriaceae bacterium]